jgi:hypothetical protein
MSAMRKSERALTVLWPAFVMAGVLEALVFAVVDPELMSWFGGAPLGLSRQAVYTITFFIFWGVIATASAMTQLLASTEPPPPPRRS